MAYSLRKNLFFFFSYSESYSHIEQNPAFLPSHFPWSWNITQEINMIESVCFLKPWEKCELLGKLHPREKAHAEIIDVVNVFGYFSQESTSHHWIGKPAAHGETAFCPRSTELGKRTKLNRTFECTEMLMVAEILHSTFHLCQLLGRACIWYFKYNLLDAFKPNQRFGFNFFYSSSCLCSHLWPQLS